MDGFWEKISSYNIFNNLFPGAFFIYFFERATRVLLSSDDIIKNVVLYYFVGLVIGRIGSIIFEPILKYIKVIKFAPYNEYLSAYGKDGKIEILQETANMYRTLLSMSLILFLSLFVVGCYTGEGYFLSKWVSAFMVCLFVFSYAKQTKYIVKRVISVNKKLP
ncbi:phosphohistidine phosphatase [Pectobacterium brasiliense]|uniref:phosphohistidine phosphatase n=1 Tax=Pectobacterium brasiliense TaxID=180957 RepID=UPI003EB90512